MIPPSDPLLANMPSGRDIHSTKPFIRPALDDAVLAQMRAPPERTYVEEELQGADSSDEEEAKKNSTLPGSFPGNAAAGNEEYY